MSELSEMIENVKAGIAEARDTVKLKAHLFQMEVRDALPEVDGALNQIEERLDKARDELTREGEEAQVQAALFAMEARDRWQAVQAEFGQTVRALGDKAEQTFDEARLQAELGRLEAADAIEKRASEAREWAAKPAAEKNRSLQEFMSGIKDRATELVDTLKTL
ncbi:MAG: hypothetical protein AAFP04_01100 [Myxococcota bacterium]